MRNWKTTVAGIAALVAVVAKMVNGGVPNTEDIAVIAAAAGLLMAKDHNVTGGSVHQ